jgi:hypothetical protein
MKLLGNSVLGRQDHIKAALTEIKCEGCMEFDRFRKGFNSRTIVMKVITPFGSTTCRLHITDRATCH